jgi:hypothetical protein
MRGENMPKRITLGFDEPIPLMLKWKEEIDRGKDKNGRQI